MKTAAKDKKPSIIRWRGILAEHGRRERIVIAIALVVACLSLTCCQLGFAGIGLPGEYSAYAVVLLLPVALAAFLLGVWLGTFMGLVAGVVLYLHATYNPLDYYELMFVTPMTSIVMLTVTGFLLGLFFAIALRKKPGPVKSVIYTLLVCGLVSYAYSVGFVTNVIIQLAFNAVVAGVGDMSSVDQQAFIDSNVAVLAFRLGDVGMQARVDALLMAVFCVGAYAINEMAAHNKRRIGLRMLYATWLSVVVLFAFMITAAVTFVAITQRDVDDASDTIRQEVSYLCSLLDESNQHVQAIESFMRESGIDPDKLSEKAMDDLISTLSTNNLMTGYEKDADGTVVIAEVYGNTKDYIVSQSNDDAFSAGSRLEDCLKADMIMAITDSMAEDKIKRVTYDPGVVNLDTMQTGEAIRTQIVYLYAKQQDDQVVIMFKPSHMVFAERDVSMAWTSLSELALLLAVFAATQLLLSRVLVRRIDETNAVLSRITNGDLNARVEARDTRELESLSDGINDTVDALKGWISEAETRMDAELATAKEIQEAALPRTFPPFPDIAKFDIYASMHAAKEVGGDFYDFFLIGDDCDSGSGKLAFLVADVSGKGVPAALFMMKAKTQIRGYLESGMELGEAIENANRQLVDGNDAGMFVTAWAGVLEYATGHVEYVNAGHNPPLLWQAEGGWRWLDDKSGMPLGLFDGFGYEAFSVDCSIGDQFLLYSDGVTEAMSVEGELYGEQRLEGLVNVYFTMHPRKLIDTVRRDVARHASGAEQSDDITILALEVGIPPEVTATIIVPADDKQLPVVNDFIHTELDRRLCPLRAQNQLDIAVEELFVNVCHYAYTDETPESQRMVRIGYTYMADPPSVRVDIADDGVPYNPLAKPDAVTPDDIMEVPIGGLGILMAKNSVDEMTYERIDDSNIVSIVKKW